MNNRTIIVFDFETGSRYPETCEPIQLAGVAINPRSLEIDEANAFSLLMKPTDYNKLEPEALAVNKIKIDDLKEKGFEQKVAWNLFADFVGRYNPSKGSKSTPIAAGHNIVSFDLVIAERLCKLHGPRDKKDGKQALFFRRDKIDLLDYCFLWFENETEPENYKLDTLREFFGMSKEGAHDAKVDVTQTAQLIVKFIKLHRQLHRKPDGEHRIKFKGAFAHGRGRDSDS